MTNLMLSSSSLRFSRNDRSLPAVVPPEYVSKYISPSGLITAVIVLLVLCPLRYTTGVWPLIDHLMPLSSSKQIFAPTEAASSTISGNVSFIHCSVLSLFFPALSPEASEKSSQIHAAHSVPVSYGKYLDEEPDDTYIVRTDDLLFVWDNKKDRANIKKHGISFEEAHPCGLSLLPGERKHNSNHFGEKGRQG